MKASEEKLSKSQQKEKIRKRYKGIDPDELEVIPALPKEELYDENKEKRVAVYARVSTDEPRQTSSYELQKNHYEDVVNRKLGWKLIKIYADEGITGTWLKHREDYITVQHMLDMGRTGSRSILPELKVIESGVIKGFITVNPTWSGFKPESYKSL